MADEKTTQQQQPEFGVCEVGKENVAEEVCWTFEDYESEEEEEVAIPWPIGSRIFVLMPNNSKTA